MKRWWLLLILLAFLLWQAPPLFAQGMKYPGQATCAESIQWLLEGYQSHRYWAELPPEVAEILFRFHYGKPYDESTRQWDRMWMERYRGMVFYILYISERCKEGQ